MPKIDLKKEYKSLYLPSDKKVAFVDVLPMNFLMIDGVGAPEGSEYQNAVEALFSISYTLKFYVKKSAVGADYIVMPLESLWWTPGGGFDLEHRDLWHWTAMIMQPTYVIEDHYKRALDEVARKKDLKALPKVRFKNFHEGHAAQILYIGPFSQEGPTVKMIHESITRAGCTLRGKHHEIYLSDFRRTASEKLKTVIRQPLNLYPPET